VTGRYEDLDRAFELTQLVSDENLRGLYEVLVHRMREESTHVSLNTAQQLLLERIATNYVLLKAREGIPIGDAGGFEHGTALKDFNTYFLSMLREFNAQLQRAGANDRDATVERVRQIIISELQSVEDPGLRNDLVERFARRFDMEDI
jgi:hypothetical protein